MRFDADLFIHPSDKAAMDTLKAIPGFSQVMKAFMKVWDEKTAKILNMSTYLKLSDKQMKKYYDMLPPICEKLGIEVPELYVRLSVTPNAYTWGDTKPYIVLTSGLFETLPDELITSVIAHECGHIACRHSLYTTMGNAIINGTSIFTSGLGNIALYPIQLAFAYWMRCSELSADRAAAIYEGNSNRVVETMMRFAGYDKDIIAEANVEAFIEQAKEYKELVNGNAWNKTLEFIMFNSNDHPLNAVRALEVKEWAESERFATIMNYLANPEQIRLPAKLIPHRYEGKNVEEVREELLKKGYEIITTERVVKTDKKVKTNCIVKMLVDGNEEYIEDYYMLNTPILLKYYEPMSDEEIALEHPNEIKVDSDVKAYLNKNYKEVESQLRELGFQHIECKEMAISKLGIFAKQGQVAKIVVGENLQLKKDSWYNPDIKVVIYYYVSV